MKTKREPKIDADAAPCTNCKCTRAQYTCTWVKQRTEPGDSGNVAVRRCLRCKRTTAVDVAFEVPRLIKTVEQWRQWWALVDAR